MSAEISSPRRVRHLSGRLPDMQLRNHETRDKPYKVADGNSVYVLVAPTGLRAWRWKFHLGGKEKVLPRGTYPEISLAEARAARDDARSKVKSGIDPMGERTDAKLAALAARDTSFESVARAWHKVWSVGRHQRYDKTRWDGWNVMCFRCSVTSRSTRSNLRTW